MHLVRVAAHFLGHFLDPVDQGIGAIVEQPRFFPSFTGRKNLALLAGTVGIGASRVDAVLDEDAVTSDIEVEAEP